MDMIANYNQCLILSMIEQAVHWPAHTGSAQPKQCLPSHSLVHCDSLGASIVYKSGEVAPNPAVALSVLSTPS